MWALWPLSQLYRLLARALKQPAQPVPVPVVVVGNLVAGGAGKTPTVIALVHALQNAGWQPGIVSRGHGRVGALPMEVHSDSSPRDSGDEPLLLQRRTQVPVFVGVRRVDAARALCAAYPRVNVLVSDDGLQHHALPRVAELLVFDERGAGNGLLLPAGPLRQPMPTALRQGQWLLYNAPKPSTPLPGPLAMRGLSSAWPLTSWLNNVSTDAVPLTALRGQRRWAAAGIASPARFFDMLKGAGLNVECLPLPDHHDYNQGPLPWPAGAEVLVTEKDAVKLASLPHTPSGVWVLPLDFRLPAMLCNNLLQCLGTPSKQPPT